MIDCQVCVRANGKTLAHLKSVFKMSTVCSNATSKTWTPLQDRFIDDRVLEMFPLYDQARLQLVDVTNLAAVHTILQFPQNLVVDWIINDTLHDDDDDDDDDIKRNSKFVCTHQYAY